MRCAQAHCFKHFFCGKVRDEGKIPFVSRQVALASPLMVSGVAREEKNRRYAERLGSIPATCAFNLEPTSFPLLPCKPSPLKIRKGATRQKSELNFKKGVDFCTESSCKKPDNIFVLNLKNL